MAAYGTHKPNKMNGTETKMAILLEEQKRNGTILDYKFEAVTLKLADDTRYTPDFMVTKPDFEIQFIEVKGFWRDDAKVKIKVASAMFPFVFVACRLNPKKDGGGWERVLY